MNAVQAIEREYIVRLGQLYMKPPKSEWINEENAIKHEFHLNMAAHYARQNAHITHIDKRHDDDEDGVVPPMHYISGKRPRRIVPEEEEEEGDEDDPTHRMLHRLQRMMERFNNEHVAIVELSVDEYKTTLVKMMPNINAITNIKIPRLGKLKSHVFNPRKLVMRLPIDSIQKGKKNLIKRCCGCNEVLLGNSVANTRCMSAYFCVPCAMVTIDAVGPEMFYDCMRAMSHYDKGTIGNHYRQCRHNTWTNTKLLCEIEKAKAMFCQQLYP